MGGGGKKKRLIELSLSGRPGARRGGNGVGVRGEEKEKEAASSGRPGTGRDGNDGGRRQRNSCSFFERLMWGSAQGEAIMLDREEKKANKAVTRPIVAKSREFS